jgi:hypothetical protein
MIHSEVQWQTTSPALNDERLVAPTELVNLPRELLYPLRLMGP